MTQPKEPANGSKSDQNKIFLSEMTVYFRPTCASGYSSAKRGRPVRGRQARQAQCYTT